MSTVNYIPVPEGYMVLSEFAEKHNLDVASLACAAFRGDVEHVVHLLRPGVIDVYALIVKEDVAYPDYVDKFKPTHEPMNEDRKRREANKIKCAYRPKVEAPEGYEPCDITAKRLDVTYKSVYTWCRQGLLDYTIREGNRIFVRQGAIPRIMTKQGALKYAG